MRRPRRSADLCAVAHGPADRHWVGDWPAFDALHEEVIRAYEEFANEIVDFANSIGAADAGVAVYFAAPLTATAVPCMPS